MIECYSIAMTLGSNSRRTTCTQSKLEWIVLGLGLLALLLLAFSWRDLNRY